MGYIVAYEELLARSGAMGAVSVSAGRFSRRILSANTRKDTSRSGSPYIDKGEGCWSSVPTRPVCWLVDVFWRYWLRRSLGSSNLATGVARGARVSRLKILWLGKIGVTDVSVYWWKRSNVLLSEKLLGRQTNRKTRDWRESCCRLFVGQPGSILPAG